MSADTDTFNPYTAPMDPALYTPYIIVLLSSTVFFFFSYYVVEWYLES